MEIIAAVILGIIQGLTEFLPISSSAHLILVPWFFGWDPEGLIFDVSLHVGTALAVVAFFWRDWVLLAREAVKGLAERRPFGNARRKLAWFLVAGTVPAGVVGLMFEKTVENSLRSPLVPVFTLAVFGCLLFYAEKKSRRNRELNSYTLADAIWIGCAQALALIPGVSRSGVTITTALLRNSDRNSAARFSFLLSTPVIVGAGLLKVLSLFKTANGSSVEAVSLAVLGAGVAAAAVTGFLCIKFFLRYLTRGSFLPFVVYRLLLAVVILIFYFLM
ncbi:MAG: undecaprenyl-diphosphate phosphatase [Acidobacteria bacterium]|nr:undecaprenyl-diphosphate phosphatase [Acidobacteriota bacterium]